jgi:hypothetical protein
LGIKLYLTKYLELITNYVLVFCSVKKITWKKQFRRGKGLFWLTVSVVSVSSHLVPALWACVEGAVEHCCPLYDIQEHDNPLPPARPHHLKFLPPPQIVPAARGQAFNT